jgi:hypothetical protein
MSSLNSFVFLDNLLSQKNNILEHDIFERSQFKKLKNQVSFSCRLKKKSDKQVFICFEKDNIDLLWSRKMRTNSHKLMMLLISVAITIVMASECG